MSGIKLFFLQASRCIRTAWQLEELGLQYDVEFSPRVNKAAPPEFKQKAGGLGKFPTMVDNGVTYYESTTICEYLEDKYDTQHRLLPPVGDPQRYKVLQWIHASEATYMLHGLACLYTRWNQVEGDPEKTVEKLSKNVINNMNYLEDTLSKSSGKFLLGDNLTAADIMMHFSARFIIVRELGTMGKKWPKTEEWLDACEATESYKKAVKHTGHEL